MKADGEWQEDIERLKDIFTNGFERLYRTEQVVCHKAPDRNPVWGNCLSDLEAHNLVEAPFDAKSYLL